MSGQQQQRKQGGGPLGLVVRGVGAGVGIVAEYREHRKEQKLSRETSRQSNDAESSRSVPPPQSTLSREPSGTDLAPPAYSQADERRRSDVIQATDEKDEKNALKELYDEKDWSFEDDEEDWKLDEMVNSRQGSPERDAKLDDMETLVQNVLVRRPSTIGAGEQPIVRTPLPFPVILPQRRPGSKSRGFVRAYAPLLGECSGIDQDTFLAFLENFDKSTKASPALSVIYAGTMIAGLVPEMTAQIVSIAGQVVTGIAITMQERHRTNSFLDRMNDEFFKPAGLYAMIVKYKADPDSGSGNSMFSKLGVSSEVVNINTNQAIAKYDRSLSGESGNSKSMSQRLQNLRVTSGTTQGAINLPAAAPLLFPALDNAIVKDGPETFKDKAADAKNFLADYMDRKAQMKYAQNDPDSQLVVPEDQRSFRSKWADPNHPMFSNGPVGFISGGYITRDSYGSSGGRRSDRSRDRSMDRSPNRHDRRMDRRDRRQQRGHGGPIGLAVGLVKMGVNAASGSGSGSGNRQNDSSYNAPAPVAPYGGSGQMRRSFDDRDNNAYGYDRSDSYGYGYGPGNEYNTPGPAPAAPYGGTAPQREDLYGRSTSYGPSGSQREYDDYGYGYDEDMAPYQRRDEYSGYGRQQAGYGGRGGRGGVAPPSGMGIKRRMKEDVLYLMIVNMPSEEELVEARRQIELAKNSR